MKYIGGKIYDNDGSEMPMFRLNQIVKISQEYAEEARKKKYNSKKYNKKDKSVSKSTESKKSKELTTEEITNMLSKNLNFKVVKK